MNANDHKFLDKLDKNLGLIAHDSAVRNRGNDEGYSVEITADDIKKGTGRVRLKTPILEGHSKTLISKGYEAEVDYERRCIQIYVPPLLENKDLNTLKDIEKRAEIISEINIREACDHGWQWSPNPNKKIYLTRPPELLIRRQYRLNTKHKFKLK